MHRMKRFHGIQWRTIQNVFGLHNKTHIQRRGRGIQHCSTKMQIATERIRIRKVIIIEELRAEIAKKILNSIVKHKSSSPKKFLTILFIITYYGRRRSSSRRRRWRWRDGEIFRKWRDMKERHKHVLCDDKIPFRCASSWQRGFSSSSTLLLVTVAVVWRYAVIWRQCNVHAIRTTKNNDKIFWSNVIRTFLLPDIDRRNAGRQTRQTRRVHGMNSNNLIK